MAHVSLASRIHTLDAPDHIVLDRKLVAKFALQFDRLIRDLTFSVELGQFDLPGYNQLNVPCRLHGQRSRELNAESKCHKWVFDVVFQLHSTRTHQKTSRVRFIQIDDALFTEVFPAVMQANIDGALVDEHICN